MCILIQNELGYKISELYYLCKVYELFTKIPLIKILEKIIYLHKLVILKNI